MKYSFVLSGWEGFAIDNRVLRDAVTRPNGLRVPTGNYYLCDCGYTNGPGFLAPYRGVRYHLDEFSTGTAAPRDYSTAMVVDPLEDQVPEYFIGGDEAQPDPYYVDQVETSQVWTNWCDTFVLEMFNDWRGSN
ncbi:hypothetical protein DH2020_002087 [Rehmannia glutinosa]|uniref:DDE Tnp4 domain-containing protein n=1 Tax=Rehmannia glutinosa TaxID=99300 RepID=A0ABR0XSP8_REHGL